MWPVAVPTKNACVAVASRLFLSHAMAVMDSPFNLLNNFAFFQLE